MKINPEGTKFELDEDALTSILMAVGRKPMFVSLFDVSQVPKDTKVSMVSIVGAFRTGKSFLLDLFLRYLRYSELTATQPDDSDTDWILTGVSGIAQSKLEANANVGQVNSHDGFSWRAGKDRNTTGIWIWGTPFLRKLPNSDEKVAVFLLDTQGMFDSETSQMLTASIFGLSTLMSSYQIYNVDKRIQEDNLQHLALFTEYGRMALKGSETESQKPEEIIRPFQRLEFLVRDWQNFEDESDFDQMRTEMDEYLDQILGSRTQQDLADTREQINACFDELSCWLLPHPGFEVTKKNYDGDVSKIRPEFLQLASKYLGRVFGEKLTWKKIHGNPVTAPELLNFIKVYVNLFKEATIFPEAKTLLEATAEANNVNCKQRALEKYKSEMATVAGTGRPHIPETELLAHHQVCCESVKALFQASANMGRQSQIHEYFESLGEEIEAEKVRFVELNKEKNPYKNIERFILPALAVVILYIARVLQDSMCYDSIGYDIPIYDCKQASVTLSHMYWAIVVFMLIVAVSTGQIMMDRVKLLFSLIKAAAAGPEKPAAKAKKD